MRRRPPLHVLAAGAALLAGCSLERVAVNRLGDALASGSSVYASDDDPEFVGDALPFGLKTIETLLARSPEHEGLLLAASSGFSQYAYAFLQAEADYAEEADLERATRLRGRAVRMYRRALGYAQRGLEARQPGWRAAYDAAPAAGLRAFGREDVGQLYWTAAPLAAAVALAKDDSELAAELPLVDALLARALALDEAFGEGALHEFAIAWEGGRPAAGGGSVERARRAFERAVELSGGKRAGPFVTFAETVAVARQDRAEFEALLARALDVDVDAAPQHRLANLVAQQRARWLAARADLLFVE